jgi:hypothetical protein
MTTEERLAHLETLASELIVQNRRMADHIQKLQRKLSEANHLQREQEELADETEVLVLLEQAKQALLHLANKRKQRRLKKKTSGQVELEEFLKSFDGEE